MPIVLKTRREIELMRVAGKLAHDILVKMSALVRPGISTAELGHLADEELYKANAVGLSKNYPTYKPGEGFPASTCISVNEEVVHGIPSDKRVLKDGDIVTLDITPKLNGYCADTAITVPVGQIRPQVQKLLDVTRQTLDVALEHIKARRK
jgi:methionyl aminopeptidase